MRWGPPPEVDLQLEGTAAPSMEHAHAHRAGPAHSPADPYIYLFIYLYSCMRNSLALMFILLFKKKKKTCYMS